MRVLVTGATGFTGTYTVRLLVQTGIEVRCFARASSNTDVLPYPQLEWVCGDIHDYSSLIHALKDIDTLINIVSIGAGRGQIIVRAAEAAGVKRVIFISTTSLFTQIDAASKSMRIEAEKSIQTSSLDYTILRPTMIYGSVRDRNMCRLVRYIHRYPVIPIFGNGEFLQQPVYVGDVADAIFQCLENSTTVNRSYNVPGAETLTYNQVIDTVCRLAGRRVLKVHLPARPVARALSLLERFPIVLPLKAEQILRLNEHKHFDYTSATQDFGYSPRSFEEGMLLELKDMGVL